MAQNIGFRLTWSAATTTPVTTWSSTFRWRSAPPCFHGACWSSENTWVRTFLTPWTRSDGPPITYSKPPPSLALFLLRLVTLTPTITAGNARKIWILPEPPMPSASSFRAPKSPPRLPPLSLPPPSCLGLLIECTLPGFLKGLEWWAYYLSSFFHVNIYTSNSKHASQDPTSSHEMSNQILPRDNYFYFYFFFFYQLRSQ